MLNFIKARFSFLKNIFLSYLLLFIISDKSLYSQTSGRFKVSNVDGTQNTIGGVGALQNPNNANYCVAIGYQSLQNASGNFNTAIGCSTLVSNTGTGNTAIGYMSLWSNQGGSYNTAVGYGTLSNNTTGNANTASGYLALNSNFTGDSNTANGYKSLLYNSAGSNNTAMGTSALMNNVTGNNNTAVGHWALTNNTIGSDNSILGAHASKNALDGSRNTVIGYNALFSNNHGSNNVSVGYMAGYNDQGSGNVFIGYQAGYNETGSNKLYIANNSNTPPLIYGDFSSGRVGINTTSPNSDLSISPSSVGPKITLWDGGTSTWHYGLGVSPDQLNYHIVAPSNSHVFYAGGKNGDGTELMRIRGDGKVIISDGTIPASGSYKLYVQTGILTEKIKVASVSNWADYVFNDDYKLKSLEELEMYVKENKHLPNIPSEQEVKSNGIDLAQMDAKLLEKIEELHLYVIDQEKTNKKLNADNLDLENSINQIEQERVNLEKEILELKNYIDKHKKDL